MPAFELQAHAQRRSRAAAELEAAPRDRRKRGKNVLFGSLELLELCPQGAEGSGGEH